MELQFQFIEPGELVDWSEIARAVGAKHDGLNDAVFGAVEVADSAADFFRGIYAIHSRGEYQDLPWHKRYWKTSADDRRSPQSISKEVKRIAGKLANATSGEPDDRPWSQVTYLSPTLMATDKALMQSLAVEAMLSVDSFLRLASQGRVVESLRHLTSAYENLLECTFQAQLILVAITQALLHGEAEEVAEHEPHVCRAVGLDPNGASKCHAEPSFLQRCARRCAEPPPLGDSLFHDELWLCPACVTNATPGSDVSTKAVKSEVAAKWNQALSQRSRAAGRVEAAERHERESDWHRAKTAVIKGHGERRAREATIALGEALSEANVNLQDTLVEPGLVAVDSSVARGRLLLSNDIVALGLDVANTADATNTIEKLLAHEIALAHKLALEEAAQARKERDPAVEIKRLQTSARMMRAFQNGVLVLQRLRTGGTQRVVVQYVNLEPGAQSRRRKADGNRFEPEQELDWSEVLIPQAPDMGPEPAYFTVDLLYGFDEVCVGVCIAVPPRSIAI